jgi:hypothetical protein
MMIGPAVSDPLSMTSQSSAVRSYHRLPFSSSTKTSSIVRFTSNDQVRAAREIFHPGKKGVSANNVVFRIVASTAASMQLNGQMDVLIKVPYP